MNKSIKKWVFKLFRQWFGLEIRKAKPSYEELPEIRRLKGIPQGIKFETNLFGTAITGIHRGSFLFQYREMFIENVYEFKPLQNEPFILDCGVNIGLSLIYFKRKYPRASIIGFEPDENLFSIARQNITAMGLTDVTLLMKGVWKEQGKLTFFSEGTDAGRIARAADTDKLKTIETVCLSEYMTKQVDFLKIDIEGSELAVLEECEHKLGLVNQLFIEYHSFVNEKQQLSKLIAILERSGYRYNITTPKVLNPKPFTANADYLGMDFLLNIYAVRR